VGPTRGLVGLVERGSNAIGIKPPVSKAMIDKYTEDIAVDGSLIQKELGFVPQYDLKTGWEETIKEMRLSGDL
jgi:nucleoside-diphosphate-sugar epimerase